MSSRGIGITLTVAAVALAAPAATQDVGSLRTHSLSAALAAGEPGQAHLVWVHLRDKGPDAEARLAAGDHALTPRAIARRALRSTRGLSLADVRVQDDYVRMIGERVTRVRHASRWFNAVSVEATEAQVLALEGLPFVSRLDRVNVLTRANDPVAVEATSADDEAAPARAYALDYGRAINQVEMIGVPTLHDRGLTGAGVLIGVFDTGFDNLDAEVFAQTAILATHDFVNGDDDVASGDDRGNGNHGRAVLSVIGGFAPANVIGPAYGATYLLAKTEDTQSETRVEEDNWAAAAEWAEAQGVDIITTSLGYRTFDDGTGYSTAQLDGETPLITRAADMAADLGVAVFTSAGNGGDPPAPGESTIGAPADGNNVLAIGGVGPSGERTSFSSVGPTGDGRIKPDVSAQATAVVAYNPGGFNPYANVSGTSFSCPLTAGVGALILQAHPEYTPAQVYAVLRQTASQADAPDMLLGWGIVNGVAAVDAIAPESAQ